MKRNVLLVNQRRDFIKKELDNIGKRSMKEFVIDLSNKIFISDSTIWKDIRYIRSKNTLNAFKKI